MCSRWFQTLFQLVQGKMCLISSDLIAFPLVRLSASSTRLLRLLVRLGRCWSQQMTYIQWVHAEPLQLVQGTEQVLPTAKLRADGPPCEAPPFAFRRDDIRLLVRLDLIADWISLPFARRWKNNSSKS